MPFIPASEHVGRPGVDVRTRLVEPCREHLGRRKLDIGDAARRGRNGHRTRRASRDRRRAPLPTATKRSASSAATSPMKMLLVILQLDDLLHVQRARLEARQRTELPVRRSRRYARRGSRTRGRAGARAGSRNPSRRPPRRLPARRNAPRSRSTKGAKEAGPRAHDFHARATAAADRSFPCRRTMRMCPVSCERSATTVPNAACSAAPSGGAVRVVPAFGLRRLLHAHRKVARAGLGDSSRPRPEERPLPQAPGAAGVARRDPRRARRDRRIARVALPS